MEHLDKLTLQRFLDGDLSLIMQMKVKCHIRNCPECQESLLLEQEEQTQQNEFIRGIFMLEETENEAAKHNCIRKNKP